MTLTAVGPGARLEVHVSEVERKVAELRLLGLDSLVLPTRSSPLQRSPGVPVPALVRLQMVAVQCHDVCITISNGISIAFLDNILVVGSPLLSREHSIQRKLLRAEVQARSRASLALHGGGFARRQRVHQLLVTDARHGHGHPPAHNA